MNESIRAVCGAMMLALSASLAAQEFRKGDLVVNHPWTRATAHGQTVAAGYVRVRNGGSDAERLLGASTPDAERIELHILVNEGDVMKMRQVKFLDLPAGGALELKPRGAHMMIIGIKRPFAKGERIPVTLKFERTGDLAVELAVDAIDAGPVHKH